MDRLEAMALLVAAVDEGSLAAAARRHARSPAAATRAVTMLERLAGEPLLLRSTRRLSLTASGRQHVEVYRDVLAKLRDVEPGAATGPLRGTIVLTAPELFGRLVILPILAAFLGDHPHVAARVLLVNRVVDLAGAGVDLAVRLMALPDSAMTAVRLGELRALTVATPAYLERAGVPATPQDLAGHECIGLNADDDGELWPFAAPRQGAERAVRVTTRLALNNAAAAMDAALAGHGLVRARSYQVVEHIRARRLVCVLDAYEPAPIPVHLVFHANARRPVLRAFVDRAAPLIRAELKRIAAGVSGATAP